ncbi:TetR/AcrR family transcriptional regulator [Microbacterium sp. zg.Y1090]|uniref:TetR/AcrR family transcriptional regulator n=1 Tax=Microbacterium TaxID=33882 RepID=UPI00214BFA82|nr:MULTISPECIES: TetR/AcrR family transcriptional regulator [unclassified Microbacterium]MCR2813175.1 TetR/AcrR family transcriptional regulator [Microbacterium sp. zg.Y1084]MCR2819488.1 TetR/AcrR family transcriptional regulator [Microbacterium sp. zg.Y1090]MDL5487342.1 TetR/AcrR family transcriptional regulator [Microbacterium sp. zg-Y1211]WIM28461.1 TetR/AcrR family transcriptional regulator [Microbacterium sp. zg-Y1090]
MKQTNVADAVTRAAVDLFAQRGYANTSVQQIVEAAGVTKGAMYHYFESKDDLLFGIYDRLLTLQKGRLDEIVARGGTADEVLRAVCVDVIETSIAFLPEGTVFFRSAHMLSAPRQQEVTRRRRAYHDEVAALIEQGRAEGLFRTDIPVPVLIAHFFSDVHYLSHWYSPSGPESATQVAEQLTDLFLTSIRTTKE